jgi:serine/threonine protein kinase/formylglycine-generating enzyme required for sulfatase activity
LRLSPTPFLEKSLVNTVNQTPEHPANEELAAFALGKAAPNAETIAEHIANCPRCETLVAKTPRDTFLGILNKAKPGSSLTGPHAPKLPVAEQPAYFSPDELPEELRKQTKYTFLKKLGGGGMGVVYLAEHNLMKRKVAVKLIPPELIGNPAVRERFLREVVSAAALEHPNVVRAYSAEEFGQHMVFEMEFVDGLDLGQVVKNKGPLPVVFAVNYIRQAAQALQHGMLKSLVHRDIKPGNLMLTRAGSVKVADFGLAKFSRETDKGRDRSLTGVNATMGTPDYMAPEQARNAKSADIRADIYSLGCTFYYLLTGQPPFTGESITDLIFKHWEAPRPEVSVLRNDVPKELSQYIQKMMAKEPSDRPQTPKDVVDWLTKFAKELSKKETVEKPKVETVVDVKKKADEIWNFDEFTPDPTTQKTAINQKEIKPKKKWLMIAGAIACSLVGFAILAAAGVFKKTKEVGVRQPSNEPKLIAGNDPKDIQKVIARNDPKDIQIASDGQKIDPKVEPKVEPTFVPSPNNSTQPKLGVGAPTSARTANRPHLDFVRGLRKQNLPDLALQYLDVLKAGNPPAEIAQLLPIEYARTWLDLAAKENDESKRNALIGQARREIELFLAASPTHELAPQANVELARLYFVQGKTLLRRARRLEDGMEKDEEMKAARQPLLTAAAKYKATVGLLDAQIRMLQNDKTPAGEKLRRDLIDFRLQAKLDEAITYFHIGDTYTGSETKDKIERRKQFADAARLFETVMYDIEKLPLCWVARAWFANAITKAGDEAEGDRQFKDLLSQKNVPAAAAGIRVARYFLILKNSDDWAKLERDTNEWLRDYRAFRDTNEGLGTRYMLAFAKLNLGMRGVSKDENGRTASVTQAAKSLFKDAQLLFKELTERNNEYSEMAKRHLSQILMTLAEREGPKVEPKVQPTFVPSPDPNPTGCKPGEVVEVEIVKGMKMKFCWIPPGKATLGSPATEAERRPDEVEHEFTTKGFWLGKYAVTQEQWEAVMGNNPSWFAKQGGGKDKVQGLDTSRFPVETVSWGDCQDFLKKLNEKVTIPATLGKGRFSLPHEHELEYACRGGKGNKQPFYFGEELNGTQANCRGNFPYGTATKGAYVERTTEVGSYEKVAPHSWGLCDMSGNLWQWCSNEYSSGRRVLRGGCWTNHSGVCRSAYRYGTVTEARCWFYGFRVVFLP